MLQILGRKTSSNVQKVLWCCEEIGLSFDRQDVGGEFGKNKTPGTRRGYAVIAKGFEAQEQAIALGHDYIGDQLHGQRHGNL